MGKRKILIDATVVTPRLKGAGRVAINLLRTLPKVDPETEYIAAVWAHGLEELTDCPEVVIHEAPSMRALRWELRGLDRAAAEIGPDLVFTLREYVPRYAPTVVHVAEPPAYRLRGLRRQVNRPMRFVAKDLLLQALFGGSVRRAAAVVAGSQSTATWLRNRYGVAPVIVHPGIDPIFLTKGTEPTSSADAEFFLHSASGDHRDNTDLVLRAFARANLEDVRLCLVGTRQDDRRQLLDLAERLGISRALDILGWVDDSRLKSLYEGAIAFVQPSEFESHGGLQPFEAMALGTPVIALDTIGVSEALEDAAVLIPRPDPEILTDALIRVATDGRFRSELQSVGMERAARFSWPLAAARIREVFDVAIQRVNRG